MRAQNGRSGGERLRQSAELGLLVALAMVLSYLETLVPLHVAVPGVKMGLPNLVTVFLLYRRGWLTAGGVSLVRVLLTALLFGNPVSLWYGLAGAALSLTVMALLRRTNLFSPAGVSVAGGVLHNFGQIGVACLLMENRAILVYLPPLCISGAVTGVLIGLAAALLLRRLPTPIFASDRNKR